MPKTITAEQEVVENDLIVMYQREAARITKQNKELRAEVKELRATIAAWNKADYDFTNKVEKAVADFCEAFDLYPDFQGV